MTEKPLFTNRLIREKSPYLLQHAHNPIDWYPWGEEAFAAAKASDKPIFLSIGYATCHWCHTMEQESFEDVKIATMMNEMFINIKVDREELPEVDSLYMEFAQSLMAGAAGWPLNVILTPNLLPFFAATYLPPYSNYGLMGLPELVGKIKEIWYGVERERVKEQAEKIVEMFAQSVHLRGENMPFKEQIDDAAELLFRMADPIYGGMKGAPKFPIGYQWSFLLRYFVTTKDNRAPFLVERTLDMMQRGGIYDHLGGGFSRYAVDESWLVPHFEKMLYDNALLVQSYLETWQGSKQPLYREVCEHILHYILREMTHPQGGFYSAEDADSEGLEGKFYTWTYNEIQEILGGEEKSTQFCEFYGVTKGGNFEGRNILHTKWEMEEFAQQKGLDAKKFTLELTKQKQRLWEIREQRIHPFKDDKILSSWNGLMIASMVEAGRAFNNEKFVEAALQAARFIKKHMWREGLLFRRWRDGEALFNAGLDEYAFLIKGVLSLFEAGCGTEWLFWALEMNQIVDQTFKEERGAYYQTDGKDKHLLLRKCQLSDGAEPSGNSVQCENLLRLYQMTSESSYLNHAEDVFRAVKMYLDTYPISYCNHLMNLNRYYDRHAPTIIVVLNDKEDLKEELMHEIYSRFIPHKALIWRREDDVELSSLFPSVEKKVSLEGQTTLYICFQGKCEKPLTDIAEMKEAIQKL